MCRQEARQSARTSSGQAKFMVIFNGKCVQRKSQRNLVHVGTFQCGKTEQWKSKINIASPSSWGHSKQDLLLHQESHLIGDFFHKPTWTMSGHLQKNASLIAATLTDAWQEPGTILAMNWRGVGSRNLVGGNGRTRRNWPGESLEPSGT